MHIFQQIIAPNGEISHIFGVLHLTDAALKILPIEVATALNEAKIFVCEADARVLNYGAIWLMQQISFGWWENISEDLRGHMIKRLLPVVRLLSLNPSSCVPAYNVSDAGLYMHSIML